MLQDFRKIVGIKSEEELEARRYKQQLHENPKAGAAQYFELGGMHQKAGDKEAAIEAFFQAASLATHEEDWALAMAANKAIVHLEPEHKDALANLAYLRFQHGIDEESEKKLTNRSRTGIEEQTLPANERDEPDSSESHEIDATAGNISGKGPAGLSEQLTPSDVKKHPGFSGGAKKTLIAPRPKTRLWGRDRRSGDASAESQRRTQTFEANRKSLIDLIEGGEQSDFSTSFELERQSLVDLIKQSSEDDEAHQTSSESPIYLGEQPSETSHQMPTVETSSGEEPEPSDHASPDDWEAPEEVIDLRSGPAETVGELSAYLYRCALFSPLSQAELRQLQEHVHLHTLSDRMAVSAQQEIARSLFVLFKGEIDLSIHNSSGKEELTHLTLIAGDFFGEHTFWKQNTLQVAAHPRTACTLGEISAAIFLGLARKYPVMLQFLKKVCKRRYFAAMLAKTAVFQECTMQERQTIAEYLSPVHVARGVPILPEGDSAHNLYIIQSGEVNVFTTFTESDHSPVIRDTHEQVSLAQLGEGDVFGEESFFSNEPGLTTFWARTDLLLLKLSGACLTTFAEQYPQFRQRLYAIYQQRSRATMQTIQSALSG